MNNKEQDTIIKEFIDNGELLHSMGQYGELAGLCREFLESFNEDRVYSMLSSAEFALGDIVSAEKSARKGLSLNPGNPDHLLNLAYILQNKGCVSNALRYFARAQKIGDADISGVCEEEILKLEESLNMTAGELTPPKAPKRVLIIAAIFPPESGSGVQRTVKLVKYLRMFGWEPVVLTLPISKNPSFSGFEYFDELPDDIEVIRIPEKSKIAQSDIENMKTKLTSMLSAEAREEFENIYNRLDWQQKFDSCCFPEPLVSWAYNVAENIGKYVNMSNIDLIYSTSGPYCDHFAAYYIKQNYNKPWVVDFCDEWSNNPAIWPNKNNLSYRMCLDCERSIIDSAERLICVTEKSLENYLKLGFLGEKLSCITNGYDEEDFEGINDNSAANEKFTLIHNGLLHTDRTPKTVLTALKNLIKRKKIDADKIKFYMGKFTDETENTKLKAEVKRMGLEKIAFVTQYMEHRESLLHIASANLLILILGPSNNYVATYPAKIFEYLRLNKPVLSLGPGKSVIEGLLKRTGHGVNVSFSDVAAIENEILRKYQTWIEKNEVDILGAADVSDFERKNLVGRHAEVFNGVECLSKEILDDSIKTKYDTEGNYIATTRQRIVPDLPINDLAVCQSVELLKSAIDLCTSNPMMAYLTMRQAFELDSDLPKKIKGLERLDYTYDSSAEVVLECCPVCKSKDAVPYYNAFSYQMSDFVAPFSPAKLWIKCGSCGNLYSYGFPRQRLESTAKYKLITPQKGVYFTAENLYNTFVIWDKVFSSLRTYTGGQKLLEIGIGNGELLAVALELGYDVNAVEIVESAAQKIADILNIPIHCIDFLKFETDERDDIITMGDVIEHVTDPCAALEKARSLLKPKGVLWLSTPNFESSWTRMHKFKDAMWSEPSHITWFSRNTLVDLLREHGFKLCEYALSARYKGSMEIIACPSDIEKHSDSRKLLLKRKFKADVSDFERKNLVGRHAEVFNGVECGQTI